MHFQHLNKILTYANPTTSTMSECQAHKMINLWEYGVKRMPQSQKSMTNSKVYKKK